MPHTENISDEGDENSANDDARYITTDCSQNIEPHVYPSFIIASARIKNRYTASLIQEIRRELSTSVKEKEKQYFESIYYTSYEFYYNERFVAGIKIEYIGNVDVKKTPKMNGERFRIDLFCITIPSINFVSIHGHILFEDPTELFNLSERLHAFFRY